ncbi:MAG: hypothetical protein V4858_24485 [Pseudomonadota bacterium]
MLVALELPDGTARRALERLHIDRDSYRAAIVRQYEEALNNVGITLPPGSATHDGARAVPSGKSSLRGCSHGEYFWGGIQTLKLTDCGPLVTAFAGPTFLHHMPKKENTSLLVTAMDEGQLVRIIRRFEDSPVRGYVAAVGPTFFLLTLVSDRLRFDGFECFRMADVRSVRADPYAGFAEAALKKRGLRRPRKPKIDLDSVETILLTAAKVFPLVTIHLEKKDPDVCYIGSVRGVERGKVFLLGINPHAEWDSEPDKFRFSKITRISFGGDYEDALHAVGGDAVC